MPASDAPTGTTPEAPLVPRPGAPESEPADEPASSSGVDDVEASGPTDERAAAARRRFLRLAIFGMVLIVFGLFVLPKVPRSQQLRLHLGIGASRVVSATARVGHGEPGTWDRESTWRFEHGAPATLPWAFDLPNGSAQLEVELSSATGIRTRQIAVDLQGDETRVELEDVTRGLE